MHLFPDLSITMIDTCLFLNIFPLHFFLPSLSPSPLFSSLQLKTNKLCIQGLVCRQQERTPRQLRAARTSESPFLRRRPHSALYLELGTASTSSKKRRKEIRPLSEHCRVSLELRQWTDNWPRRGDCRDRFPDALHLLCVFTLFFFSTLSAGIDMQLYRDCLSRCAAFQTISTVLNKSY